MKKVIHDNTVHFYDDNDCELMFIEHSIDDCIWFFNTDAVITATKDMELYSVLEEFMNQDYLFSGEGLQNYKDKNKLVWYSDCYYDPDNEWSVAAVSCLNIERKNGTINIWCTKKLDEKINRKDKTYGICFSPCGNGKSTRNTNTGSTLQNDFVIMVYRALLETNKVKKK